MQSAEAAQIRLNEQLKLGKDLATDFATGFARDLRRGVDGMEAFSNGLNRIADKLMEMAIQNLVAKAFAPSGGPLSLAPGGGGLGGIVGLIGSLFGGGATSAGTIGGTGGGLGGRYADGGTLSSGWGIVGERGPELINAHPGGGVSIYSNPRSRDMLARGLPGFADGGHLPAANRTPQPIHITIDVSGANGDAEIDRRVKIGSVQAVNAALAQVPGIAVSAVAGERARNPKFLRG
jgi:hypothetical protein